MVSTTGAIGVIGAVLVVTIPAGIGLVRFLIARSDKMKEREEEKREQEKKDEEERNLQEAIRKENEEAVRRTVEKEAAMGAWILTGGEPEDEE